MWPHSRVWISASSLSRKVLFGLLALLFPTWFGSGRKYQPEKCYMRGP